MLNKFKFAAVALAALVATATFTASTEQAQAAKLSKGTGILLGVGAALLAGAAIANQHHQHCKKLQFACHNKKELGLQGAGTCRRYREAC
jgi:hypothetical protein